MGTAACLNLGKVLGSRGLGFVFVGTLLDLCVSSLRGGHAKRLCINPSLSDDPRRAWGSGFRVNLN